MVLIIIHSVLKQTVESNSYVNNFNRSTVVSLDMTCDSDTHALRLRGSHNAIGHGPGRCFLLRTPVIPSNVTVSGTFIALILLRVTVPGRLHAALNSVK